MDLNQKISIIPLGGASDVTRNMYVYEYKDEILLIDCGLGFANETMLGVDLLIPDVTYLKNTTKKIVGMAITHGHEDHLGALPYILPDLPSFPIFATPLTAEFCNSKLKEFGSTQRVQKVEFDGGELKIGSFTISFIRITHSVPDTSNIFIKTPVGNFYHGSDFKFDLTPYDGKKTEFKKIAAAANQGIMCLLSDSLGSERPGRTPTEQKLTLAFEEQMEKTEGKFIVTTYSSNISRLNQVIHAAKKFNRKICFIGRSIIKAKDIAQNMGYMKIDKGMEVTVENLRNIKDENLVLIVAGSQGQENSALTRIVNDDFREVKLTAKDTVVFSSDPIPGNEISVNSLLDAISKKGVRVFYSAISSDFHVSGHGSSEDIMLMMSLTNPKKVLPIGGTYRHMVAYKNLARRQGFLDKDILIVENGQEVVFSKGDAYLGRKIPLNNVYVDQISGEELESFVLRDRKKIAKDGIVIVVAEIDAANGQLLENPNIIVRGLSLAESKDIGRNLAKEIKKVLVKKTQPVTNWIYVRKIIGEISEKYIFRNLRKRPLVLPVVIEV